MRTHNVYTCGEILSDFREHFHDDIERRAVSRRQLSSMFIIWRKMYSLSCKLYLSLCRITFYYRLLRKLQELKLSKVCELAPFQICQL